jgi:phage tail sheath protein FI
MPLRPGTQVLVKNAPPARSAPTDTGVWFVVGQTDSGPTAATLIRSMDDFIRIFGTRQSFSSSLYDAVELFFREGGSAAYVSRVVGPAAVTASKNLLDAGAGISLVVKALGPGAGSTTTTGNSLKVAVVAGSVGGTYVIQILDSNNVLLETSPNLTTQQDAITWSAFSQYVTITLGATALVPAVAAAAALTGGADDRNNITDTQWLAALNLMGRSLGPGNVSAPGRTTDVGHTQLLDHAAANNRVALLDLPDSATGATLTTSATNAKATGNGAYGGAFWPWIIIPGTVAGTFRTVAPSALVAGRAAATDALYGPDTPAAGEYGQSNFATGLSQLGVDATTRDAWNTAGINVIRSLGNLGIRIYGWRSLADPVSQPNLLDLSVPRYLMGLVARALNVGEQFMFKPIDGQGRTIQAYGGALTAICQGDWESGQIYGVIASEAFNVDVGPSVNTPSVLAGNELRANIAVRPSPDAELVTVQIVNVPITSGVS